jgi:hypothetical protein
MLKLVINDDMASRLSTDHEIAQLYPNIDENKTPLPRRWSSIHKWKTITLSNDSQRIIYTGQGQTHTNAASIRTDHPIPATCGIYYYEVKIVNQGQSGEIGIGLANATQRYNQLPGII